ncbi:MAG: hypothetical protein ACFCUU_13705 [Cyclobacteriaceae bacterium]
MKIHYYLIILFFISSCSSVDDFWEKDNRTFTIKNHIGKILLKDCGISITSIDGKVIDSKDNRFIVKVNSNNGQNMIYFEDQQKEIDFDLSFEFLDDESLRIDCKFVNSGSSSFFVEKITAIYGYIDHSSTLDSTQILVISDDWEESRIIFPLKGQVNSLFTMATINPSFTGGFLTGKNHFNRFSIEDSLQHVFIQAWGEGNGCEIPPATTRLTDPLFISFHENSLQQLERFADLAAKENDVKLWPENRAVWCTWYAGWNREYMYSYREGIAKGVEATIPEIKNHFFNRGAKTIRICDDHIAYGDWNDTTNAFPNGLSSSAKIVADSGLIPGVWYPVYWASSGSETFKKHRNWFAMEEDGSPYFLKDDFQNRSRLEDPHKFLIFDSSNPEVQMYFEETARKWKNMGFEYVTNDFLAFATAPPKYHDPTYSKAQVLRKGLESVKRGLGDDVFYRTIGAQFGTCMGLSHDVRMSGDSHGDRPFAYHRTAANWFYNHRVWLNDPSAIVFMRYGEFRDVEWNKMWISWIALAGTVMTYGEQLDQLPNEYIDIYKKMFPPIKKAGRPLDLWENDPYTLWGMKAEDADGAYDLFGVFGLEDYGNTDIQLNLDEISSRTRGWEKMEKVADNYLLWDFWNQKIYNSDAHLFSLKMPSKSCRIFSLRPNEGRPQFLATSGHFSMGFIETQSIAWDAQTKTLTGKAKGNAGDATTLFFHVPQGFDIKSATIENIVVNAKIQNNVLQLEISDANDWMSFQLEFTGQSSGSKSTTRAFVKGKAASLIESESF